MITKEVFYGGSKYREIDLTNSPYSLTHWRAGRVFFFNTLNPLRKIKLPNATLLRPGGPHFYLINVSQQASSFTVHLFTSDTAIASVDLGIVLELCLVDNTITDGVWVQKLYTYTSDYT